MEKSKKTSQEKKAKAREFHQSSRSEKQARQATNFNERKEEYPAWQFALVDWDGPWGWKNLTSSLKNWATLKAAPGDK